MEADNADEHGTGQRRRSPVAGADSNGNEDDADHGAERWHPAGHFKLALGFADPALEDETGRR